MVSSVSTAVAFFLILFIVSSKLLSLWRQHRIISQNGCKPEPRLKQRLWLNGYDMSYQCLKWLQSDIYLQKYASLFVGTGKTISIRLAGERKLKTIDPHNSRYILASRDGEFEKGKTLGKALRPAIGDGILGASGAIWTRGRALIRPAFGRRQITNLDSHEAHFQDLLARIPADGSTVDLKPLLHHFTFDTSSQLLLGASPHTLRQSPSPEALAVEDSFDYIGSKMISRIIRGKFMFTHRDPKFFNSCRTLHQYFDKYISKAVILAEMPDPKEAWEREMPGTTENYVLIREALKATNDRIWLRDQLISSLVGGRDTTASLMSIVMHFLARDQRVGQKLREEVDLLHGAIPTYETFKDMPYLESVINESVYSISAMYPALLISASSAIIPSCSTNRPRSSEGHIPAHWWW